MANTVDAVKIWDKENYVAYHLMMLSDGTNETKALKVDKSALVGLSGNEPYSLALESIRWCMQGFSSIQLEWDRDTDVTIMRPSGNGFEDLFFMDGKPDSGTGGTGDVLLTTNGAVSGATYDITLIFRKA